MKKPVVVEDERELVDVVDPVTGELTGQLDLEDLLDPKGKRLDRLGREIPDPRPMAPPIGFKAQPELAELIRRMVISEQLAQEAAAQGAETFEEADDFVIGDDYDPRSPYEMDFDPPLPLRRTGQAGPGEDSTAKPDKGAGEPPAASAAVVDKPVD